MKLFNFKKEIFPIFFLLILVVVGIIFYGQLPAQIPTHWGINGEINGWSSRNMVVFYMPIIYLIGYLFLSFIVLLDPLRKNVEKSYSIYWQMKFAIVLFLSALHVLMLNAAMSTAKLPVDKIVIIGTGALFFFLGALMPKIKRNFFIGIKSPWTLSSDEVWKKTHEMGMWVFEVIGVATALSAIFKSEMSFIMMMVFIIGGVIFLGVYSYLVFRKTKKIDL
ncbi:MAG: DUF1648 domain-containing protein [Candidatus Paceibacterota bacterium]